MLPTDLVHFIKKTVPLRNSSDRNDFLRGTQQDQGTLFWALGISVILIIITILLSSCDSTISANKTQSVPLPTFPARTTIHAKIRPIRKWKMYDVNAIAWSMDNSSFAVAGEEQEKEYGVYSFRIDASNKLWYSNLGVVSTLIFRPDNQVITVPMFPGVILLDAASGQINEEIMYYEHDCFGQWFVKYSPNGGKILTVSETGDDKLNHHIEIHVWDVMANFCLATFAKEDGIFLTSELSRDGRLLVLGIRKPDFGELVQLWNVEMQQKMCEFSGISPAITPGGELIAAVNNNIPDEVDLWDVKSCRRIDKIQRKSQDIPKVMVFHPNGRYLAIGSGRSLEIWQITSKEQTFSSSDLMNDVEILAFSPDGRFLLSAPRGPVGEESAMITLWGFVP